MGKMSESFADSIVAFTAASDFTLHSQCTLQFLLLFWRSFVFIVVCRFVYSLIWRAIFTNI